MDLGSVLIVGLTFLTWAANLAHAIEPASGAFSAQAEQGKTIFLQSRCSPCHTIGGGKRVGPDLKGTTTNRSRDWLMRMITVPDKLIAEGNPVAIQMLKEYGNLPMPNLNVSEAEAAAILAYLDAEGKVPATSTTAVLLKPVAGDPLAGKDLFTGVTPFKKGGAACMACHNIAGLGSLAGGSLGPEITQTHVKYGEEGIIPVLANLPFPTMKPLYHNRPLTSDEQGHLKAFLQSAVAERPTEALASFLILGLGGFLALIVLAQVMCEEDSGLSAGPWSKKSSRKRGHKMGWIKDLFDPRTRQWEEFYRNRWQYDRVVRSTHGVNCTGGCSWMVYVKDGIITWELQATDYPSLEAGLPPYEPRGCQRGISFSWYVYSPIRVKYPYVRGVLIDLWRRAKGTQEDPVEAWASIVENDADRRAYQQARGKGGFRRTTWDEVLEIIAASTIYTIKKYGPDRIIGFSPIPAMSMLSYAGGSRFLQLLGGVNLSFYDWYSDLPPASPEVWGERTDVCESADWYNSKYIVVMGSNLNMTRTPDVHFVAEARHNGTKLVVLSPRFQPGLQIC